MREIQDLATFRNVNSVKQQELSELLCVSRGYISLIEGGKARFSEDKISELVSLCKEKEWMIAPLFPSAWRILQINEHVTAQGEPPIIQEDTEVSTDFIVSKDEWAKFLIGMRTISEDMAHRLCHKYPTINYTWLIDGNGPMLKDLSVVEREKMKEYLFSIDRKIDILVTMLQDQKSKLAKLETSLSTALPLMMSKE